MGWVVFLVLGLEMSLAAAVGLRGRAMWGEKGGELEIALVQRITVIVLGTLAFVCLLFVGLLGALGFLALGLVLGHLSQRAWPVDLQRTRPPLP
jgi:hypothetical protein